MLKQRVSHWLRGNRRAWAAQLRLRFDHSARLAVHPQDWPWSSFAFYCKRQSGLVPIDPVQ